MTAAVGTQPQHWTWRSEAITPASLREIIGWIDDTVAPLPELEPQTETKLAVRNLVDENARLRAVLGHCPRSIAVLDEEGRLVGYNQEFRHLFSRAPELGQPITAHFDEGDRKLLTAVIGRAGSPTRVGALVQLDGPQEGRRSVEFLVATIPSGGERTIGVVLAGEDRTASLDEEARRVADFRSVDQRNYREAFGLAQSIVHHELSRSVGAALLAMRQLHERGGAPPDEANAGLLRDAIRSLEEAAELLANVERQSAPALQAYGARSNVRECAERAARLVEGHGSSRGVHVEVDVDAALEIAIDGKHLTQILTNVLTNSVQAIEEARRAGTVRIHADSVAGEQPTVAVHVRDDGIGIDPWRLQSSFEAFATTRADDGGTGLGLAIVKRLVDSAGGRVRVISQPNAGTELVIELPSPRAQTH